MSRDAILILDKPVDLEIVISQKFLILSVTDYYGSFDFDTLNKSIAKNNQNDKYKPIDDESLSSYKVADLTIKEFYEGTGRKTGMLGSLLCVGNIDGKEIQTKIGSGFTDEERQEIWNNRQEYLDGEIEVKYQSITKNQNEENLYALQFGIKVAIKLDR